MTRGLKALLLIGSPKVGRSTSGVLGASLLDRLEILGLPVETARVAEVAKNREAFARFLPTLMQTELLILSFPLYADSLPAVTTRALEWIADWKLAHPQSGPRRLAVIVNCGFPEAAQTRTAVSICRCFSARTDLAWAGALAMGAGGALGGRSLDALGGMMRRVRKALTLAAQALAGGEAIPAEAQELMARPLMPARIYLFMGSLGFKREAKKAGALGRLHDRPYIREKPQR